MADETDTTTEVARVLRDHDAERMECYDHEGLCCPAGDAHGYVDNRTHQAAALAKAGLLREPPLEAMTPAQMAQEGLRLASQREDLIAAGVDPAELLVVLVPRDHGAASLEVTPAVRRAAQALLMTEHGEHADMYEPRLGAGRLILAGAFDGEEIARQLCEQTGPAAYHGPIPCDEHSLAVAVVRDVMLGDNQGVAARRDEIIGDGS